MMPAKGWFRKPIKQLIWSSVGVVGAVLMILSGLSTEDYIWAAFWFAAACGHVWIIVDEVRMLIGRHLGRLSDCKSDQGNHA
jgi:drug/metabolite transporter (DMT)-like permease